MNKKVAYGIVNMLTVLRLVLSICFLVLLGLYRTVISESGYAALFAAIGLTDFFDGKLARKWKVQSTAGAWLDVGVDFFFILSTSGILCLQGNLPFWMIAVIIAKMFEFVVTSRVLRKRRSDPVFDLIGRLVAVGFYLLPILVILLRERKSFAPLLQILPFVIAAGALLSTVRRISRCVRRD